METFARRIVLVPLGLIVGFLGGAVGLVVGLFASGVFADIVERTAEGLILVVMAMVMAGDPAGLGIVAVLFAVTGAASIAAPLLITAATCELFRIGAWWVQVPAVGLMALALPSLLAPSVFGGEEPGVRLAFLAAGFVAGFLYWLIAGRGLSSGPPAPPAPV